MLSERAAGSITHAPLEEWNLVELVENMNPYDLLEAQLSADAPYDRIDWGALIGHQSYRVMLDGFMVCAYGVRALSPVVGVPWALRTRAMDLVGAREIYSQSKAVMEGWTQQFRYMYNFVGAENSESIRWLPRLGFTVWSEPVRMQSGASFYYFDWRSPQCVHPLQ